MLNRISIVIISAAILALLLLGFVGYALYRITRPSPVTVAQIPDKKITIIEGWTNQNLSQYLEKQLGISSTDFENAQSQYDATDYEFLASKPARSSLEGFLFPDTYLVLENSTAEMVIDKLLSNFGQKLNLAQGSLEQSDNGRFLIPGYESLAINGKKGLSIFELVTLASIVERETGRDVSAGSADSKMRLNEERKIVAGIFYNRLLSGQALQSDATVNYVTGKNEAAPSITDTQIKSLYNTYVHAGLPPGPISNPSLSSLQAVFAPQKTNFFYFLHKQPSGEVIYSKTFDEHVRNKNLYLR